METKFCCEKFRFFYSGEKTRGLNIRVVKLSDEFVRRGQLHFDISYMITEGYSGDIGDCKKKMVIQFCPFCGVKLDSVYSKEYVQEIMNP